MSTSHAFVPNASDLPLVAPGQVTLVGAGPGDPELLTLAAVRAIGLASVLLVDDLVADAVLAYASPQARVVPVGKRGGCRSTPQPFIGRLMVMAARERESVVRLKGGDPFIFGRGGEEVDLLRGAGIPVRVVNGITAGLAGLSSLGVPLTHRAHAHGVVFVTGHAHSGDADIDWPRLASAAHGARLTLVIYMGVAAVSRIARGLLGGLPAATPVAVIQNASLPQQRHATGTLGGLAALVADAGLGSPSVIVVGEVARGLLALGASARAPVRASLPA